MGRANCGEVRIDGEQFERRGERSARNPERPSERMVRNSRPRFLEAWNEFFGIVGA